MMRGRLGFHYYPDDLHFTHDDLRKWIPILSELGAKWITLRASVQRAVPEPFIQGLMEADIQPIIHIPDLTFENPKQDLLPLFKSYAQWGVEHVVAFDRPNLRSHWDDVDWGRASLVERFVDRLVPLLEAQQEAGLRPVFPPLEPGGDYWDLAFLEAGIESISRRGYNLLLKELHLALYAWVYDKPLDWGYGGSIQWPEARPYHTPPGCQDHRGFRIFDWYAEITSKILDTSSPMLVIAGGALPDSNESGIGPNPYIENNLSIARALRGDDITASVLGFCFYLLTASPSDPEIPNAWFDTNKQPKPMGNAFLQFADFQEEKSITRLEKPFQHYLLILDDPFSMDSVGWSALGRYAADHSAVIGFSVDEAKHAEEITLVSNEPQTVDELANDCAQIGCTLHTRSIVDILDDVLDPEKNEESSIKFNAN